MFPRSLLIIMSDRTQSSKNFHVYSLSLTREVLTQKLAKPSTTFIKNMFFYAYALSGKSVFNPNKILVPSNAEALDKIRDIHLNSTSTWQFLNIWVPHLSRTKRLSWQRRGRTLNSSDQIDLNVIRKQISMTWVTTAYLDKFSLRCKMSFINIRCGGPITVFGTLEDFPYSKNVQIVGLIQKYEFQYASITNSKCKPLIPFYKL